ncbi:fumarate/nitrate reduction transcriptional regulator Fnr [Alteromonadaceae bacterium BrNp21-10]|nr:fumarate/nitrate reduction transcriptional regulator Fnr [Alteromonadaceae bacterium BrNp21-10]
MLENKIHCQYCNFSQLCLPSAFNGDEMTRLDNIIERKKPYQKQQLLFQDGTPLNTLFAIRSGSFKSFRLSAEGEEQIIGFHFPGDVIGLDALQDNIHHSHAQALETSMVCEIPYDTLDSLSANFPKLRSQVLRIMSGEISHHQEMMQVLTQKTADERLNYFLQNLSARFAERGFSSKEFRLSMTRGDIGNYLGLTVETVSRLLGKQQKLGLIKVDGKFITLLTRDTNNCTQP